MSQSGRYLSRVISSTLVIGPLCIMVTLTITVLVPALKDPESKIYGSSIGYPALKRLVNQPIKVQTVAVRQKALNESVAAPGESVALLEVDVRPLVSGIVEKVYVVEGQWVSKGDTLLQIDQTPFQDGVNRAHNNLAIAETDLQTLPKVNQERLVELQANLETAKKKLAITERELETLPERHQESLVELQANLETAKTQLAIAEERLAQLLSFQESGAVSRLELFEARENYTTRKNELISAQQQVAQARLDMSLELNDTQQEYAEQEKELIAAQQELASTQSSIQQEFVTTTLDAENSEIDLRQTIRDLNNTTIYASTNGLVSRVNIHNGETASPETSVITLTGDVVFKAYIDQAQINSVKISDPATVRLVAYPGQTFQGKVTQLNPTVETDAPGSSKAGTNRQYTYSVWIQVDELQMPPGLQGYTQFGQEKASLVIPESAFTHLSAGEGMVMVAQQGQAVVKKVKVGRKFDNQREVLEGLKIGEQVVLYPRYLNPGDSLKLHSFKEEQLAKNITEKNAAAQTQPFPTQKNTPTFTESATSVAREHPVLEKISSEVTKNYGF